LINGRVSHSLLGCSLKSLLGLLAHENTDIAIDVVALFAELTDDDAIGGWLGIE
jgi:hypothetical protein